LIGGGVMGSSIAYWLRQQSKLPVTVIEKDTSFAKGSSSLSVGSIRQQFTTKENIALSKLSYEFFKDIKSHLSFENGNQNFSADIQFREGSYLFLASSQGKENLKDNIKIQQKENVLVSELLPDDLRSQFPWLRSDDIELGSFVKSGEGWFDPYSLLIALRKKSQYLGANYICDEVCVITTQKNGNDSFISSLQLRDSQIKISEDTLVVNTAGPYASKIMNFINPGLEYPVSPKKRNVFVVETAQKVVLPPLLIIFPNGVYIRPEGKYFITGCSPTLIEDHDCHHEDFEVDHDLFESVIWPALESRIEGFEALKVVNSWAGHYEMNTFDQNAFIGYYPFVSNLMLANGFSGHGIQHSPMVGKAVSELIINNKYKTIDLSTFGYERYLRNTPIVEKNII